MSGLYRTYTGNKMMSRTAMKMIKCNHHHFLKCAPRRAPKLRLAGGETVVDSISVTPGFDILYWLSESRSYKIIISRQHESSSTQ